MATISCPKCKKQLNNIPEKCPYCGYPIRQAVLNAQKNAQTTKTATKKKPKPKNSTLSIWAIVLGFIPCTFFIGLILAIIDLCKGDGRKKTCSIIGLIASIFWGFIIVGGSISGIGNGSSSSSNTTSTVYKEVYRDENVIIKSGGYSGTDDRYHFDFEIENLSDRNLTVQVRDVVMNGYTISDAGIFCSMDVVTGTKAKNDMTLYRSVDDTIPKKSEINSVKLKFHIFDFKDWDFGYDSKNITLE